MRGYAAVLPKTFAAVLAGQGLGFLLPAFTILIGNPRQGRGLHGLYGLHCERDDGGILKYGGHSLRGYMAVM